MKMIVRKFLFGLTILSALLLGMPVAYGQWLPTDEGLFGRMSYHESEIALWRYENAVGAPALSYDIEEMQSAVVGVRLSDGFFVRSQLAHFSGTAANPAGFAGPGLAEGQSNYYAASVLGLKDLNANGRIVPFVGGGLEIWKGNIDATGPETAGRVTSSAFHAGLMALSGIRAEIAPDIDAVLEYNYRDAVITKDYNHLLGAPINTSSHVLEMRFRFRL